MSRKGALQALKVLCVAHDVELNKDRIEVYCNALEDLPDPELLSSAERLVRISKWFPKPAEIREEATINMIGGAIPTATTAWGEVVQQIRSVGASGVPNWSHEIIKQAVWDTGGYGNLCRSTKPDADRNRFIAAYNLAALQIRRELMSGRGGSY
jgi:hypothetical protein